MYQSASSQHLVTWLVQERGFAYSRAAYLASAVVLGAGLAGSLALGALTDAARAPPGGRAAPRLRRASGPCRLAATAAFYLLPPASPFFLAAWLVAQAWTLGWFGPMLAAIHERAPAGSRATVIGFSLMAVNLVGVGPGPWVTGAIGDRAGLTTGLLASVAVGAVGLALVGARRPAGWRAEGPSTGLRGTRRVIPRDPRTGPGIRSRGTRIPRRRQMTLGMTGPRLLGMTTLRIIW